MKEDEGGRKRIKKKKHVFTPKILDYHI